MEIRVLGSSELWDGAVRIEIGAAKQRALLALLVLSMNQVVPSDRLIEELWPDSSPQLAKVSLQSSVYRLRKLLQGHGEGVGDDGRVSLHTRKAGYLLEAPLDSVDSYRFQRLVKQAGTAVAGDPESAIELLRSALALWRGNAFADVEVEVVRRAAGALEDQRLDAAELCLTTELDLGRHAEVITGLEALVAEQPLRERAWGLLMTALYRCGRQGEALKAYHDLHDLLNDRLGIEPTRELRELHQQILIADPDPTQSSQNGSERRGEELAVTPNVMPYQLPPRQLPPDISRFSGRDRHMAELDALLPNDDDHTGHRPIVIAVVDGTAGIGKSALAIHWAHRVKAQFPDGQLYLNLRGYGPNRALDPGDAAEEMLRSLGIPIGQIPAGIDGRSALLRSVLADKRMLVLLDNAQDAIQVRPLLPGSGCTVLITSRNQLCGLVAREGAHRLTLDHFTEGESIDMLVDR